MLKKVMVEKLILLTFNLEKEIIMEMDSSDFVIEIVLN